MEITGLPVAISGDPPKMVSIVLEIADGELPEGSYDLGISFNVLDADSPLEAQMYVNDKFVEHLWPFGNLRAHDQVTLQKVVIPGDILTEGSNVIEIELAKAGAGFTISDAPLIEILGITNTNARPILNHLAADFNHIADDFNQLALEL